MQSVKLHKTQSLTHIDSYSWIWRGEKLRFVQLQGKLSNIKIYEIKKNEKKTGKGLNFPTDNGYMGKWGIELWWQKITVQSESEWS